MCFNSAKSSSKEESSQSDERVTTGDNGVAIRGIDGNVTIENLADDVALEAFNFLDSAQDNLSEQGTQVLDLVRDFAIGSVQSTQQSLENVLEQSQSFAKDIIKEKNPDAKSSIEKIALAGLGVVAVIAIFRKK